MLSPRDEARLHGVNPDLVDVVRLAIGLMQSPVSFTVLEGLRTAVRQAELVQAGASRTMNSRHLTGHAVDLGALVNGELRWDWPLYEQIAIAMKHAAVELKVPLTWGGDWTSFRDGPHFELPRGGAYA